MIFTVNSKDEKKLIPLNESEGEAKCLGSSFIARLVPISSLEEWKAKEESFKKDHPKADHYPYGLMVEGTSRSNDDGEPGGSAGRPLLGLLENHHLHNCAIIVARYFGGSKLGIPRLRRCFLESAENAISNARLGQIKKKLSYSFEVDYPTYDRLNSLKDRLGFEMNVSDFGVKISLTILASDKIDRLFEGRGIDIDVPTPVEVEAIEEERI